jgi:hypothetical protein
MPIEKQARTLSAGEWPPPSSVRRPVTEKDNWWTLATEAGWKDDPWRLIEFNFKTKNPAEVNYYLRTLVGCKKPTSDGKNWMFSAGLNPGAVYLPAAAAPPPAAKPRRPGMLDVGRWFAEEVIPKRTTNSGFSPNRIYKSPLALARGNKPDANGLCGDAAAFVAEEYRKKFGTDEAAGSGEIFFMATVVWNGLVLNHVANVLLPLKYAYAQEYKWKADIYRPVGQSPSDAISPRDLMYMQVYDLYYKKRCTLVDWWKMLDSSYGGTITLMP